MTGLMNSKRVLLIGNHPNIAFYTAKFQAQQNYEIFHISDTKSSSFTVETTTYGKEEFHLENHFTCIAHLSEALKELSDEPLFFDLVILSTSSLQQLSTASAELEPLLNETSRVIIENGGFIQLDTYFKDFPNSKIFNILCTYNLCQVGPNHYEQFGNVDSFNENTIFLGKSTTNGESLVTAKTYTDEITQSLENLKTIFEHLFTKDTIECCQYSPAKYISQEWSMSIPKICLDPLLILFEETSPNNLLNTILAKPLISGLITEVMTISKVLGIKPSHHLRDEDGILKNWKELYSNNDDLPSGLYHFMHDYNNLFNFDMYLLQPILLADAYDIKTPYLEFLFATLSQLERLNNGESNWFVRADKFKKLLKENEKLSSEYNRLNELSNKSEDSFKFERSKLQKEINDINAKKDQELRQLTNKISQLQNNLETQIQMNSNLRNQIRDNDDNSRDIEGIADTSLLSTSSMEQPLNLPNTTINGNSSTDNVKDRYLDDREQELQRKELQLKQKEAELQRTLQQQVKQYQSPKIPQDNTFNTPPLSPIATSEFRKPSYSRLQQNKGARNSHSNSALALSTNNFVDPITSGMSPLGNQNLDSFGEPLHSSSPHPYHHSPHSIKPTSRKNRNSHLTRIGNASSLKTDTFTSPTSPINTSNCFPSNPQQRFSQNNTIGPAMALDMPKPSRPTVLPVPDRRVASAGSTSFDTDPNQSNVTNNSSTNNTAPNTPNLSDNMYKFGESPASPALSASAQMETTNENDADAQPKKPQEGKKKKRFGLFKKKDKK